ncbi:TonB-dependent receptor [Catenovulum agarivorans DS-2]|uniref:TonB-dependent receptor n=1 Tax=Catenovulum agarivorans DS-2 TaxID=1328313 RepID=W7QLH4_9ALTE|nr:TonB-dependent receptor [Catenovulum agarivorans]EWH09787.1 TonB-dependent receptor [Catenovulum agarivorans DS-2]
MFKQTQLTTLIRTTLLSSLVVYPAVNTSAIAQEQQTDETEVISVTGIRNSLKESAFIKRNATQVVDAITAEDIGKLPDNNIAEALQRVTGLQIGRDAGGEGAGFQVRGLSQNRVEVNGRSLISNNSDNRNNSFTGISSALFAGVEVIKSPSASDTEGALGATVRLKTRKPFDTNPGTVSVTAKLAYDALRKDEVDPELSLFASNTWDSSLGDFGALINVSYQDYNQRTEQVANNGWRKLNAASYTNGGVNSANPGYPVWVPRTNRFQRFDYDRQKVGVDASFQFAPNTELEFFVDTTFIQFDSQQSQPKVVVDLKGGFLGFDYQADDLVTVTHKDGAQQGFLTAANVVSETKSDDPEFGQGGWVKYNPTNVLGEEQQYAFAFGGTYTKDDYIISLQAQTSRATNDVGNINTNFLLAKSEQVLQQVNYDFSGKSLPQVDIMLPNDRSGANREGFYMTNVWARNTDKETGEDSLKIDLEYTLDQGIFTSFETGLRLANRTANRREFQLADVNNYLSDLDPSDPNYDDTTIGQSMNVLLDDLPSQVQNMIVVSDGEYMSGEAGSIPRKWLTLNHMSTDEFKAMADTVLALDDDPAYSGPVSAFNEMPTSWFDIEEKTTAVYAQQNFEGDDFRGNFGVRYVKTDATVAANQNGEPKSESSDYSDFLPSFNINYDLTDTMNLRFAAAKVMSRPNPIDLSPALNLAGNSQSASIGNPNLSPFKATQYDLSYEWYISDTSAFTAAIFYKDVASFFKTGTRNEIIDETLDRNSDGCTVELANQGTDPNCNIAKAQEDEVVLRFKENGESGTIQGLELSWQQDFSELLSAPFNGFGYVLNYTYTDSEQPGQNFNQVTGAELPLPQLSENSYNAIVYYEKDGLGVRFAYNYRDERLLSNSQGGLAKYADAFDQLDLSIDYAIDDNINLFFSGSNILDSEVYQYVGITDATFMYRKTGPRYTLGLRAKF